MRNAFVRLFGIGLLLFASTSLWASEVDACGTAPLPQSSYWVSSRFGMRLHPLSETWRMHWGVDLASPVGTPVTAVGDGIVVFTGTWGCYGNVVVLRHPGDVVTLYAHLSRLSVRRCGLVRAGDVIGAVGATGCVTGSHLHFELWQRGQRVNPLLKCTALHVPEVKRSWHS